MLEVVARGTRAMTTMLVEEAIRAITIMRATITTLRVAITMLAMPAMTVAEILPMTGLAMTLFLGIPTELPEEGLGFPRATE